jgi:5'-3' exonuclease
MGKMPQRKGSGEVIEEAKQHVLLIDGNALYKTGYHGAKNEFNSKGEHIGGVYQFLTMVRKLLMEDLYHKVFTFWDGELSGKLRFAIYPDYKSGRGKDYINGTKPEDDKDQIIERAMVQEYLEELFIRQLEHPIVESDDFIAHYCNTRKDKEKITIVTNDRDLCQLIDENVRIYLCDKKVYVDTENYQHYFKHHLDNSALIKIISGDSSDSIKGVKGVKETTLLKHFPELLTQKLELDEIISKAKVLQESRVEEKKKPLKALDNIINGVTDGVQGDKLYNINTALVDLTNPLLTPDAEEAINELIEGEFSEEDRGIKNALQLMKRDGIDKMINTYTIDYMLPFKKLIARELKHN